MTRSTVRKPKLGIVTYDVQHRKTQEVAFGLHAAGLDDLTLVTVPFSPRKPRDVAFAHRPDMFEGPDPRALGKALGADIVPYAGVTDADGFDYLIIGGAGLLPVDQFSRTKVLNVHPGLTPLVRGLDSFKWAILDGAPIGNTLHYVDAGVDSGEVIAQRRLPIFSDDTIELVAQRLYRDEINMMLDFQNLIAGGTTLDLEEGPAHMRMPRSKEALMLDAFPAWRDTHAVA